MKERLSKIFKRYAVALSWVYFTILFGWLVLYLLSGDHFSYFGLMNNLAVYLFFPLPLFGLIAIYHTPEGIDLGHDFGCSSFRVVLGWSLYTALKQSKTGNPQPVLTVMTYNVLGMHGFIEPTIGVIRSENADVIFLQELTPDLAQAMQDELADLYPFQILDPQPGVWGMGLLSRYPLIDTGEHLPLDWIGTPQILKMDFEGRTVTLVNFHTFAYVFIITHGCERKFAPPRGPGTGVGKFGCTHNRSFDRSRRCECG